MRDRENPYWVNICRHFTNGVDVLHDKQCRKGVCYRDVTARPDIPGASFRLPCQTPNQEHGIKTLQETGPAGTCEHFSALSEQELREQEEVFVIAMAESSRKMQLVSPLIVAMKKQHRGKSARTLEVCPACGGRLHMSHSGYNGHVWGKCETEGCVSWME